MKAKFLIAAGMALALSIPLFKSNLFAGPKSNAPAKVEMCHMMPNGKTQTILVSPKSVNAHLAHGDALGACL